MKCPRCGAENPNDVRFCVQCGLSRTPVQTEPTKIQKQPMSENVDYNIPMKFHSFFSIATLCVSIMMILLSVIGIFSEDEAAAGIIAMLPAIYYLIMSILLIKRKKVGNVLRLIINIWAIVQAVFIIILLIFTAIVLLFIGVFLAAESELAIILAIAIILSIVIVIMFFYAGLEIAAHSLMIYYYKKRKHMFN